MASKIKLALPLLCLFLLWPTIADTGTVLCSTVVVGGTGPCGVGVPQNNANQPIGSALPVAPAIQPTIPVLVTQMPPFTPTLPSLTSASFPFRWNSLGNDMNRGLISDGVNNLALTGPNLGPAPAAPAAIMNQSPNPSLQCPFTAAVNQTASTTVITNPGGKAIHVCGIVLISATQQGVTTVEGTGTACATNPTYWDGGSGGTVQVAANGGFAATNQRIIYPMQVAGDNVCVLQSGSGNVSGHINYGIFNR